MDTKNETTSTTQSPVPPCLWTVGELIDRLSVFDEDALVCVLSPAGGVQLTGVDILRSVSFMASADIEGAKPVEQDGVLLASSIALHNMVAGSAQLREDRDRVEAQLDELRRRIRRDYPGIAAAFCDDNAESEVS
jgi:hypothetical protein